MCFCGDYKFFFVEVISKLKYLSIISIKFKELLGLSLDEETSADQPSEEETSAEQASDEES